MERARVRPDGDSTAIAYAAEAASHRVKATITETVKEADGSESDKRQSVRLYNILGELVEATDGSDKASSEQVTMTYEIDTSGLLKTVTADGVATSFEYDAAGNRKSVTNPDMGTAAGGKSVKFAYTGLGQGRLGRRTYGGTAFSEEYEYAEYARLEQVKTNISGTPGPFVTRHAYDGLGRPSTTTYPSMLKVERGYNARGYLETLTDATTAKTLVTYEAMDAYGNIEEESFGNGAETTRMFDPKSGRPMSIKTARGMSTFQDHAYAWLTDGSLESRTARAAGSGTSARALQKEEFAYDHLGRLDSAATKLGGSASASRTLDYAYDPNGNLTSKTSDVSGDRDVTSTMYGQRSAGPHALTRARVGGAVHRFHYDAQGHLEWDEAASGDDRFIEWDGRGLAVKVTVGTAKDAEKPKAREAFAYGPGGARYRKTSEWRVGDEVSGVMKSETTHYVGAYEKRTRACTLGEGESATESKQSVERTRAGPALHVRRFACGSATASTPEIEYRHFDHLGSSASVTNSAGSELVSLAHDPHGERRRPDWTRRLSDAETEALASDHPDRTSRGFTGHEHLDRTGLAHMNGRLYDPLLGRFLSPDPIVANPADGQQWNLYSYAGNSPLSRVDPSGLTFCDVRVCGGTDSLLPGGFLGGGGRGGYGTRTVSVWGTYVTFGIYHRIVRIWRSSSSFNSWGAGDYDGGWSDDTYWEDVQQSVIEPIFHIVRWVLQVVEQSAAAEPASSAEFGFSIFEVDPDTGRIVMIVTGKPIVLHPKDSDDPDYEWKAVPVEIKGRNGNWYKAYLRRCGHPGGQTNCHGATVGRGQVWINGPEFQRILNDYFEPNGGFKKGNLIVWQDDKGNPSHSGIIKSVDEVDVELSMIEGVLGMATEVETLPMWYLNLKYGDSHALYESK